MDSNGNIDFSYMHLEAEIELEDLDGDAPEFEAGETYMNPNHRYSLMRERVELTGCY